MTLDREQLEEFLEHVADKYSAAELVEILEDMGLITVWTVLATMEDEVIEARERLDG